MISGGHYIEEHWAQFLCIEVDTWDWDESLFYYRLAAPEDAAKVTCKFCLAVLERLKAGEVVLHAKTNRGT